MSSIVNPLIQLISLTISSLELAFLHLTLPFRHSVVLTTAVGLTRSKAELIAENALLRQQMIIYRQVKKPLFTQADPLWLVLLARRVQSWKQGLLTLKPDRLLR